MFAHVLSIQQNLPVTHSAVVAALSHWQSAIRAVESLFEHAVGLAFTWHVLSVQQKEPVAHSLICKLGLHLHADVTATVLLGEQLLV